MARIALAPLILLSAISSMATDLSTPEKALLALENAYTRKDLDGAVAAKDFLFEAEAMLRALKNLPNPDKDLILQTAQVLELSFRKEMKTKGFPDFKNLRCSVVRKTQLEPGLVEMVEECVFPDGGKSVDMVHAAKSERGWRIVILPSK